VAVMQSETVTVSAVRRAAETKHQGKTNNRARRRAKAVTPGNSSPAPDYSFEEHRTEKYAPGYDPVILHWLEQMSP
jgi:hypothetical protein